jgi:hypothetical protein
MAPSLYMGLGWVLLGARSRWPSWSGRRTGASYDTYRCERGVRLVVVTMIMIMIAIIIIIIIHGAVAVHVWRGGAGRHGPAGTQAHHTTPTD